MFKSLFRCIRRFFSRIKPSQREALQRRTDLGANIDIEEALAEELEIQRRSGRTLSSTASIAAALRQRPRDAIPVFSTHNGTGGYREPHKPATKGAVEEMQRLIPGYLGQTSEKPESLVTAKSPAMGGKSPMVSKRVTSSSIVSSPGSSFKIPESVPEDAEPEKETDTKTTVSATLERPSELNPRRSSIYDMRSEWI